MTSKLTKQHFKTIVFRSYFYFLKINHPNINFTELCEEAGLPLNYVLSEDNWVSLLFERRFMNALKKRIPDKSLCFNIGGSGINIEILGKSVYYLLKILLPLPMIYKKIASLTNLFNKVVEVEIVDNRPGNLHILCRPNYVGLNDSECQLLDEALPDIVENIKGYWTAVPRLKGLPLGVVKVIEHESGKGQMRYFEIRVTYKQENKILKFAGYISPALLGLVSFLILQELPTFSITTNATVGILIAGIVQYFRLWNDLSRLRMVSTSTEVTLQKLDHSYQNIFVAKESLNRKLRETQLLNKIIENLVSASSQSEILQITCEGLVKILNYDRSAIMLADSPRKFLEARASFSEDTSLSKLFENFKLPIEIPSSAPEKISNIYRSQKAILISDVKNHIRTLDDISSKNILLAANSVSFICAPIGSEKNSYGVVIVDCVNKDKILTEADLEIVSTIGKQVAIAIERDIAQSEVINAYRESDGLKDKFLANTSHELKTPLNGMLGLSESLLDGVAGPLNSEMKKNLEMIVTSTKRLSTLVEDILDFSKLKKQTITLNKSPVCLLEACYKVIQILRPIAAKKGLFLTCDFEDPYIGVLADPDRLEQILTNLVDNGLKFTHNGDVVVSTKYEGSGKIGISITDTGIGIAEEDINKLFKSFTQLDPLNSRRFSGAGLGLSITRDLVELHGGQIYVSSIIGKGTSIKIEMPSCPLPNNLRPSLEVLNFYTTNKTSSTNSDSKSENFAKSKNKPEVILNSIQKERILIVDDDPINLQVLVNQLKGQSYEVILAQSGKEALAKVKESKPDLILLDVMMPEMTGYEVCQTLRKTYSVAELPIIFLTAKSEVEDKIEGFRIGANDYMIKPFPKLELMARFRTQLASSRISKEFSKFVPWGAMSMLGYKSIFDVRLGHGIETEMTILFTDIRDFTSLCETMSPDDTLKFLNSYLARIAPVIAKHKGIIDKYIGDAVMAIFLTPQDAVAAAIDIQYDLITYNIERRIGGRLPIKTGFGINTGPVVLGPVGYENKMDITVLSDTVNVASRLEAMSKNFGTTIIVSESTYEKLILTPTIKSRNLGPVEIRGKSSSTSIYELINLNNKIFQKDWPTDDSVKQYHASIVQTIDAKLQSQEQLERGIKNLEKGEVDQALRIFEDLIKISSNDEAVKYFCSQCNKLLKSAA